MPSPLSVDLRERVVAAVADGAPKPCGSDRHSHRIEAHADTILALDAEQPTLFLSELRAALSERGIAVSRSSLSRVFKRHKITRKKVRPTPPSSSVRT